MNKQKTKYLIIVSSAGEVHGSFYPWDTVRADEYLADLRKRHREIDFKLHEVCNLNRFLATLKHGHKKQRENFKTCLNA